MTGTEIIVTNFCRLATGAGYHVTYEGRTYAVFMHRFGKQDLTPMDGGPLPEAADVAAIFKAVQDDIRGYDWQGARE